MEVYLILAVLVTVLVAVLQRHRSQSGIGRTNARRKPEDAGKDQHPNIGPW